MKLGLFGINAYACGVDPAGAARVAAAAEAAGWESAWTAEHYVLPDPMVPPSPAPPQTPMLDPFTALGHVAAHTRTLLLGTGVTVVPLHQPLALAKRVASIDRISGGRFLFGVGVGYLEPEFEALGVPLADRGERTMDHLAAMRALWNGETSYRGRYVEFAGLRAEPRPAQLPAPPLHFGGYVEQSYRRALAHGHGWYGFALDLDGARRAIAVLRRIEAEHGRGPGLPPIEISVTPHPDVVVERTSVDAFAELGVTRLVVLPPRPGRADTGELLRFVERLPGELGS